MNNNYIPQSYINNAPVANEDKELSWDAEISNDSTPFVILPEGDYNFVVEKFERARHGGSEKLPPCNKAILHIKFTAPQGSTTVKHNLFLHTKTEGMLCEFFKSIGQRKQGEAVQMNWNMVTGATGRAKVGIRKWVNDKGEEMQSNEIKRFLEPSFAPQTPSFSAGSF